MHGVAVGPVVGSFAVTAALPPRCMRSLGAREDGTVEGVVPAVP